MCKLEKIECLNEGSTKQILHWIVNEALGCQKKNITPPPKKKNGPPKLLFFFFFGGGPSKVFESNDVQNGVQGHLKSLP